MPGPRSILVVDGDPANAKLMAVILADAGWEPHVARSAEDALVLLARLRPALIVLELVLPLMSGVLLAQQLKDDPATRDITIVAVTAFNGPEAERVARAAGCAAYVRKPIDVLTFPRLVRDHLGDR